MYVALEAMMSGSGRVYERGRCFAITRIHASANWYDRFRKRRARKDFAMKIMYNRSLAVRWWRSNDTKTKE